MSIQRPETIVSPQHKLEIKWSHQKGKYIRRGVSHRPIVDKILVRKESKDNPAKWLIRIFKRKKG